MLQDPKWDEQLETLKKAEEKAFLDLSTPSLQALAHILRHEELWPAGFYWNYAACDRCAMGLAVRLWEASVPHGRPFGTHEHLLVMNSIFNIRDMGVQTELAMWKVFVRANRDEDGIEQCEMREVSPEMIADLIDEVLAKLR